jgi:hypothetical protein
MLNVIIFVTLLILLIIPTYKCEYENWGSFRKSYFGVVLLLCMVFFFKLIFIG